MSSQAIIPQEIIEKRILLIRGQKVMLDKDLAELYQVETYNLNKAVKRNRERFPNDFMFPLTGEEFKNLIFHFGRSKLVVAVGHHKEFKNLKSQFVTSR